MTQPENQDLKEYIHQCMEVLNQRMDGLDQQMETLKVEVQEHKAYVIRWVVSLFVGFSVLVVSGLALVVTATIVVGA